MKKLILIFLLAISYTNAETLFVESYEYECSGKRAQLEYDFDSKSNVYNETFENFGLNCRLEDALLTTDIPYKYNPVDPNKQQGMCRVETVVACEDHVERLQMRTGPVWDHYNRVWSHTMYLWVEYKVTGEDPEYYQAYRLPHLAKVTFPKPDTWREAEKIRDSFTSKRKGDYSLQIVRR
jgi:hypothetical protein